MSADLLHLHISDNCENHTSQESGKSLLAFRVASPCSLIYAAMGSIDKLYYFGSGIGETGARGYRGRLLQGHFIQHYHLDGESDDSSCILKLSIKERNYRPTDETKPSVPRNCSRYE